MATSSYDRATLRRNVLELFDDLVSARVARLLPMPLPRPTIARKGQPATTPPTPAPKSPRLPDMMLWLRGGRIVWVALEPTDRPLSMIRKSFRADCAELETPFAILRQPADLLELLRRQGVALRERPWGVPAAAPPPQTQPVRESGQPSAAVPDPVMEAGDGSAPA